MDDTKKEITLPIIPLDEVLACMSDKDEVVRMAAKAYYNQYYMNRSHNDRPSK